MLSKKNILVTGGTGSFGRAFIRTVLERHPDVGRVVVLSRDELKQFEMQQEFRRAGMPGCASSWATCATRRACAAPSKASTSWCTPRR
jgi:FlaA1/EpsC-like NDP-sugar epimerase